MTRRGVKIAFVAVAALCLALAAALFVVVRTSWFREKVRERIVREVERATGGRTEIGSFDFDGGALRAEVRDFVLHGTEEPGVPPLFGARRITVELKLVSALRRDVDIESLEIEAPRLRIMVHPDGSTNLPRPKIPRRGSRNAVEQFLALTVARVDVRDGTAECGIEKIGLELHGEQLRAQLFYQASPEKYLGEVSLRKANLKSPQVPAGPMDIAASVELEGNRLAFRQASLRTAKSSVRFQGAVTDWFSPTVDATFAGEISVAEFARAWSLPIEPVGAASVDGGVHYDSSGGWRARSNVAAKGLAYQGSGVRIADASLNAIADWTPGRLTVPALRVAALGGSFDGSASIDTDKALRVVGHVRELSLDRAFAARGLPAPPWNGRISGKVNLRGELGSAARHLAADLKVEGPSLNGVVQLEYDQQANRLTLGKTVIATPATRVELEGDPETSLRAVIETRDLHDLEPALKFAGSSMPQPLPVELENGSVRFDGAVTGGLHAPHIQGRVSLRSVLYQGRKFDRASASIDVTAGGARIDRIAIEGNGLTVSGDAGLGLRNYRIDPQMPLAGKFAIAGADLASLVPAGYSGPRLSGTASAQLQLQGALDKPAIRGEVEIKQGLVDAQALDIVRATVDYASGRVAISQGQARIGNAPVVFSATYTHAPGNYQRGSLHLKLSVAELPLSQVAYWKSILPAADGRLNGQLEAAVEVGEKGVRIRSLMVLAESLDVALGKRPLGSVRLRAVTTGDTLEIRPRAELAGAGITGLARVGLDAPYAMTGELQFRRLALSTIRAWWSQKNDDPLPVEALSEGKLAFRGQGFDPLGWQARADISRLEIKPRTDATGSKLEELGLRNAEPIVIEGKLGDWRVSRARLLGRETNLEIGGGVSFGDKGRFDLRFRGGMDLAILHDFEKNLSASGTSELDAEVRGPLEDPGLYGRLKLLNASLYLSGVPNGIDKANGTVFFDRHRATIEKLTAQTGGGTLSVNGFLGFGGADTVYRLQATADQVRVRYPEGISTTANAALTLTGTASRSLVAGTVSVSRSSLNPRVDFGGLLAQSSQPVVTPVISNELLRGMQFDVRIETVPNARLETTLTRDIQIEANLRLRGSPSKPILLGRISATQGELNFFGTKYNISRGEISFVNPARLEPIVNLDLETRIRGIDVTVNLAGAPNKLNMTYRSDPPLQLQELMALLTVGRAPASNPSVAVRQFDSGLDWQQVGAGALLGQALATPITGRLQRFFGVSRIKIDPQLRGIENNPQARLTVEQQISKDVTFSYITNLNNAQQQIVGLQWNVNKQWSIQAVREENGMFGVEFLYRKQFK